MSLGQRIKGRREAIGLEQVDLAREMGVTQAAVSQWEGDITAPYRKRLTKLAKILRCDVSDLVDGGEVPQGVGYDSPNWAEEITRVAIEGRVQAGLFAETNDLLPEERGVTFISSSSPWARLPLKAFRVYGDSMNEVYPHGTVLVVAPTIYLGSGWMPSAGQHVLVQRLNDWGETELTVKEIRYGPGAPPDYLELWPRSTNPSFSKPWPFPIQRDEAAGDSERMRIVGLVVHWVGTAPGT